MPNYRRSQLPGGTFFFTVVTENRQPILLGPGRTLLHDCVRRCMSKYPFKIEAMVLLPDHLHAIWTLPEGDAEYSKRWGFIKKEFTRAWLGRGHTEQPVSWARRQEGRRGVWAPRFWEHTIRDDNDFRRHMDYIHFNPVKHAVACCPHAWSSSSFHRSVRRGLYEPDWGCSCHGRHLRIPDFEDIEKTVGEDPVEWHCKAGSACQSKLNRQAQPALPRTVDRSGIVGQALPADSAAGAAFSSRIGGVLAGEGQKKRSKGTWQKPVAIRPDRDAVRGGRREILHEAC